MSEYKRNKKDICEFLDLLLLIAQNERLMDVNRCLLSQDLYFDISSIYNYIIFKYSEEKYISQNIIALSAIKKFISSDLDIEISTEILSKLFDFYSKSSNLYGDERYLDYLEFSDIFYPRYNLSLRKYLQQRNGLNKEIKSLNQLTKMLLQKLFIKQIKIIKYIIHYNDKININSKDLFNLLSNNKNFITKKDLITLFNNENIYFTNEDINSIITCLSYNNKNYFINSNDSNIEEGIYYKSFENIFNIPKKIFTIKPLTNNEKISLIKSIILDSIYQEKKVEEAKELIINREDFNFKILLNLFVNENLDNNNDRIEFNYFLKKLNLSLDKVEQELLLRRIDLLRKRYLYKSDLFDFFIPFNKDVRKKISDDINKDINFDKKRYFSKGTMIYINNLINVVLKGEKDINMKKIKLINDDEFLENIFNDICKMEKEKENNSNSNENKNDDCFTAEQLYKYIKEKLNIELTENDVDFFFIRLDKLRRGRIEILEFSDEMKYIPPQF